MFIIQKVVYHSGEWGLILFGKFPVPTIELPLQRVWLASRERLPFRTPGSVPLFGLACAPIVETRLLFTLNTPWYFFDFA